MEEAISFSFPAAWGAGSWRWMAISLLPFGGRRWNRRVVMTVCTGSALAAAAGLLDGLRATGNKRAFDWAMSMGEKVLWQRDARWTRDGKFYTAAGVSAGIDMALGFVADHFGRERALSIAEGMEYCWNEKPEAGWCFKK